MPLSALPIEQFVAEFRESRLRLWYSLAPWELTSQSEAIVRQLLRDTTAPDYSVADDVAVHVSAIVEPGAVLKGPLILGPHCFVLLCVMHTQLGQSLLAKEMGAKRISLRKFTNCLKLYLGFERWVNESHTRSQLRKSRKLLGELITMIQECFPRTDGWCWNLPKMHAFAKMPHYSQMLHMVCTIMMTY